ncbi:MAG: MipA/OmpV family protein [Rubrivivax sp.]|nr:MipA/OmpV family protein [Rubrivivax sp.]
MLVYGPEFAGSDRQSLRLNPGFYLRWDRISIATRGGFRSASEPGERGGLRIDLSPSERWRINVGLRYDLGRQESSSGQLMGMGNIPSTLRVRTSATYKLWDGWSAGATAVFDALGRGGGWQGDAHLGRELRFSPDTTWSLGAALAYAGDRHMQTYFGVTDEQSLRSGYPVYTPPAGMRDLSAAVNARTELGGSWHMFYGGSAARLLGPAAASPLTRQRDVWSANLGLVYRF